MRSFAMVGNNAYLAYNNVDLTDISEIEIAGQAQTRVGASGGVVEVRIDSPTGTVIGTSEKIEPQEVRFGPPPAAPAGSAAPAAPQRRPPSKFKIAVPANSGQHDVYFVFKNDKAKDSQIIMSLSAIEFKSGELN
jgi:cytochrome c